MGDGSWRGSGDIFLHDFSVLFVFERKMCDGIQGSFLFVFTPVFGIPISTMSFFLHLFDIYLAVLIFCSFSRLFQCREQRLTKEYTLAIKVLGQLGLARFLWLGGVLAFVAVKNSYSSQDSGGRLWPCWLTWIGTGCLVMWSPTTLPSWPVRATSGGRRRWGALIFLRPNSWGVRKVKKVKRIGAQVASNLESLKVKYEEGWPSDGRPMGWTFLTSMTGKSEELTRTSLDRCFESFLNKHNSSMLGRFFFSTFAPGSTCQFVQPKSILQIPKTPKNQKDPSTIPCFPSPKKTNMPRNQEQQPKQKKQKLKQQHYNTHTHIFSNSKFFPKTKNQHHRRPSSWSKKCGRWRSSPMWSPTPRPSLPVIWRTEENHVSLFLERDRPKRRVW